MKAVIRDMDYRQILAVCLAVLLCVLVYIPGLEGAFILDDWQNIQNNELIRIHDLSLESFSQASKATAAGPLGRPVSMVSFALNYWATGLDPYWFKLTNLLIHIGVGLGLFFLGRSLLSIANRTGMIETTDRRIFWGALFAATLWMLHPLNLTAVLYVVQRMASLASLFTVLALLGYCAARKRQLEGCLGLGWLALSFLVWLPAAVYSKESGLLLPVYCFVIELTFFRFRAATPHVANGLKLAYLLGGILMVAAGFYMIRHGLLGGYAKRDFTLTERLLTEARALWLYLKLIIVPNIGEMTLYHDDFAISRGLFRPSTTAVAIFGLLALFTFAGWALKRQLLVAFAILFFFAGHAMESTIVALEPVYEHRNYLAMYGILLAAGHFLTTPTRRVSPRWKPLVAVLFVVLVVSLTLQRAIVWGQPFELLKHTLQHHPHSTRANMWAGDVYRQIAGMSDADERETYLDRARGFYQTAAILQPSLCSAGLEVLKLDARSTASLKDKVVSDLLTCLKSAPVQVGTIHALSDLSAELVSGETPLAQEIAYAIFVSALANTTNAGRARALTHGAMGHYLYGVLKDRKGAIEAFRNAVQANPRDAALWVAYAQMLAGDGQRASALSALERATAVDRGNMKTAIRNLKTAIENSKSTSQL